MLTDALRVQIPARLRVARAVLGSWPLRRGRGLMQRLMLSNFDGWPAAVDITFRFGTFIRASTAPWPRGYRDLFLFGVMDEAELPVWRALLNPGDCVIDGGANWGYYTCVAASLVGCRGRVLAIEPTPSAADALWVNVAASGYENVTLIREALGDSEGCVTLHVAINDPVGGKTSIAAHDGEQWRDNIQCKTATIDALVRLHGLNPAVIKLDVEGSELAALRGARSTLAAADAPVVTFEWNIRTAHGAGVHPTHSLDLLRSLGYLPFLATTAGLRPFTARDDPDWSPMVWCFRPGRLRRRVAALGLVIDE